MTKPSIDLKDVAKNAFDRTASAQLTACQYADQLLDHPDLLGGIINTTDGKGNFPFSAKPDLPGGRKTVTVTAPNQEQFVFTRERGGKVASKSLRAGQNSDDVSFGSGKAPEAIVQNLVNWCAERTPPTFQHSLMTHLDRAQKDEEQRQAGIRAALSEEGLAQYRTGSDALPTDLDELNALVRGVGFTELRKVGSVGAGGTSGLPNEPM